MAKTTANISIDSDIKIQAQELFTQLGMDLSTAVNIFLRQAIRENAIPFTIAMDTPNRETAEAIKEAELFRSHPELFKRYPSFSHLLKEVQEEL